MSRILFLVGYFLAPVVAVLLAPRMAAPQLLPILLGALLLNFALHRRSLLRLSARNPGLRSWIAAEEGLVETIVQLRQEAEEGALASAQQSVRLLGLHGLWSGLGRGESAAGAFEAVLDDLRREAGFAEMAILRLEPARRELVGSWARAAGDASHQRRIRWGVGGLGGALGQVLRHPRSHRFGTEGSEPLVQLNGHVPSEFAQLRSYLVLPLLSPVPRPECFEHQFLYRSGCPAFEARPHASVPAESSPPSCLACRHFPVHGLFVVTDPGEGPALGERERLVAETLSYSIAAVISHASQLRSAADAEEFRHQILDAMSSGLLTTDETGRVLFANRRAQEWIGLGADLIGRPLAEFVEVLSSHDAIRATLRQGMEGLNLDGWLTGYDARRKRSRRAVRLNLAPYHLPESGGRGAVCVLADHSGVKAMEEEIRHLDTLAAVGRFASSLAHEIRNPLAGISAGMSYMQRHSSFPEALRENLQVIDGEIRRLDGIITNLLTVARPTAMSLARCDVASILRRCVRSLEDWAQERGVALRLVGDDEQHAYVDGDKIHQVLLNLVKNAVEASPPGREVRVTLRDADATDLADEDKLLDVGALAIEVEDEGSGIGPENLGHLFEPFFTTKAQGTGLGLFVCHNFVQRHGGVLRVQSAEGVGTRFLTLLPCAPIPSLRGVRDEDALAPGR